MGLPLIKAVYVHRDRIFTPVLCSATASWESYQSPKEIPKSPETNLLSLRALVKDQKQRGYESKKAVFLKCFLLHRRTNAGCDVCLVLLIYFCRNLQLGVCTFWRYHACIASECFYTISSLSNKFIHSIHKSRM